MQMYENEENGQVLEEDLTAILEIMLGVKELDLSVLFLSLDGPDTGKITYGETQCLSLTVIMRGTVIPLYV